MKYSLCTSLNEDAPTKWMFIDKINRKICNYMTYRSSTSGIKMLHSILPIDSYVYKLGFNDKAWKLGYNCVEYLPYLEDIDE